MNWDLENTHKIPYKGLFSKEFWSCGGKARYEWQARRASNVIKKEMDLPKFLHRQRLQSYAVMMLLSKSQRYVVDKMARPVLRESDNMANTSLDDELDDETLGGPAMGAIVASQDKPSKRLVKSFQARRKFETDKRGKPPPLMLCGFRLNYPKPPPKNKQPELP